MREIFKSTIFHLFIHKTLFLFLVSMLSVVYLIQIVLFGQLNALYGDEIDETKWKQTMYSFQLSGEGEKEINSFLYDIEKYSDKIQDITLEGSINVLNCYGDTSQDQIMTIIAFFPHISEDRKVTVKSGSYISDNEELEAFAFSPAYERLSITNCIFSKYSMPYILVGEVRVSMIGYGWVNRVPIESECIIVEQSDFFEIVSSCQGIYIQCSEILSPQEEKGLAFAASNSFTEEKYIPASGYINEKNTELLQQRIFIIAAILLCVFNVFELFAYMLTLRLPEFGIFRILGCTRYYVFLSTLCQWFLTVVLSFVLGLSMYYFLAFVLPKDYNLLGYNSATILASSLVYLSIMIVCLFVYVIVFFISNDKHMKEVDKI